MSTNTSSVLNDDAEEPEADWSTQVDRLRQLVSELLIKNEQLRMELFARQQRNGAVIIVLRLKRLRALLECNPLVFEVGENEGVGKFVFGGVGHGDSLSRWGVPESEREHSPVLFRCSARSNA
jgi:hypothetical protein